ncbi:non-ribosomal peptide synthetase [Phytomonospora sp. NPDC050363]|uniref:non-ribosomal peptide synthetase n=1 Tax=Phytomonospora sp. NPDC050363 TaxID=3155642 RepID=UPI0033CF2E7B
MTPTSVPERFARQVRRTPDAIALSEGARELTYAELDRRVNRLAHHLIAAGVVPGDRVGLRLRRSLDCVLAMLAVLRTGAAYVPLEADVPLERLRHIVGECSPRVVVTGTGLDWDDPSAPVLSLAGEAAAIDARPVHDPGVRVHPDDVMYIPYTSGSTGRPKGSVVPHRSVVGFFEPADYAHWGPGSVALHHCPLSWDGHVLDIYPALLTGGKVVVHTGPASDPVATANAATEAGVTLLFMTTQAFNTVVNAGPEHFAGLRFLLTGGEVISPTHMAKVLEGAPDVRVVACYGPSECTVFTTVHPLTAADLVPAIPIGRAVGDRRVHVLGADGEEVAPGESGELLVGGPAVAHGYLGLPRLTAERFVPDPFGEPGSRLYRSGDTVRPRADGVLDFVGRDDDQIKLRGHRIELGEIERALARHPAIVEAAVAVDRDCPGGHRLVGYLVGGAERPEPAELRAFLGETLPAAMVPPVYTWLDRLPLSRTGKLDRKGLRPPALLEEEYLAPETATERRLAEIWAEVLTLPRVGRHDDFLVVGGNSMHATRMTNRVRDRFGVSLPLPAVYQATRLADLAARVDALIATGTAVPALVPRARRRAGAR